MGAAARRLARDLGKAPVRVACLRLIARLDIKGPDLIKGIQLEGVRKLGDPRVFARRYYDQGIDEVLYMDAVASLYDRTKLIDLVRRTAENVFVPITVGGGIRSVEDARELLRAGADKIALNSAATLRPTLISELAEKFGSQCVVLSIEAKRRGEGWEAYRDGGREHTGLDVVEWAERAQRLGAGEILLTSVDREGTCRGFDMELTASVTRSVTIPVIASGGMGRFDHLLEIVEAGADAVAVAHLLHYGKATAADLRRQAIARRLPVRHV